MITTHAENVARFEEAIREHSAEGIYLGLIESRQIERNGSRVCKERLRILGDAVQEARERLIRSQRQLDESMALTAWGSVPVVADAVTEL
jgi:hypothetical protein